MFIGHRVTLSNEKNKNKKTPHISVLQTGVAANYDHSERQYLDFRIFQVNLGNL